MFLFREKELSMLSGFVESKTKKSMAIYGRRRTGKTELIRNFIQNTGAGKCIYYQCTSYDYQVCLKDFLATLKIYYPDDAVLDSLTTFKAVFSYISSVRKKYSVYIIDEFPFLAKKNEDAVTEFQWIIDHGLDGIKMILLGSNRSFMRNQMANREAPLYGRFDEIMEVQPFTFPEIQTIFPDFEDAVTIYAVTGGVAQYVMLFTEYPNADEGINRLFLDNNGRMYQETRNMLLQEIKDPTTYVSILRAISHTEKGTGQIAKKCNIDQRALYPYLNTLQQLDIVTVIENPLSQKKNDKRYKISDQLFRFHYSFIEPNASIITALGSSAREYILDDRFSEYLGFVYEDIIRKNCFLYALQGRIPFMPEKVGRWWGNIQDNGTWKESELDIAAVNSDHVLLGECKYKNKLVGLREYELLKKKAAFIPNGNRKIHFLLASRSGFTEDLKKLESEVTLINMV